MLELCFVDLRVETKVDLTKGQQFHLQLMALLKADMLETDLAKISDERMVPT